MANIIDYGISNRNMGYIGKMGLLLLLLGVVGLASSITAQFFAAKANHHHFATEVWIEGQVIDVGHNPFMGLVISIKDNLGRIFFGQSKYFKIA